MLSILIPVYNYDLRKLVYELHQQAVTASIDFEIVVMDDASTLSNQNLNRELELLSRLRYIILPQNIGRAAIRNRLAAEASFEYCLFMDCDVWPEQEDFIQLYIQNLEPNSVICGGRSYKKEISVDSEFYLHWLYGSNREVKAASVRSAHPYHSFMTNNFVIPQALILAIGFDESIKKYGHEDTVFGLVLMEKEIPIIHIENPLCHIGLDGKEAFICKTEAAVENLFFLSTIHDFKKTVRLLNVFEKTKNWGIQALIRIWFRINRKRLLRNLKGRAPKLRNLDLYKLGYMTTLCESKV